MITGLNIYSERPRSTSFGGGFGGRGPPRGRSNYRIVVEGLSEATSWQDLKDFFKQEWAKQFLFKKLGLVLEINKYKRVLL